MGSIFNQHRIDGLITTNTTSSRTDVEGMRYADEQGGLSGEPLFQASTNIQQLFRERLDTSIPIIGVGGISSAEDAKAKFASGADLVQLYTALVYQGPKLVKQLLGDI